MKRKYNEEFKKEVVKEYAMGKSYNQIEEEFNVPNATLAGWIKKYSNDKSYSGGKENELLNIKDYRSMEKRVKELEKENDFLKKAAAFFAKEID